MRPMEILHHNPDLLILNFSILVFKNQVGKEIHNKNRNPESVDIIQREIQGIQSNSNCQNLIGDLSVIILQIVLQ